MSENTLIILDWDDTMFPTSWVTSNKINVNNTNDIENYKLTFVELDQILYQLLIKCLSLGKVIIITNASYGWIDISSNLLPNTRLLLEKQISIHSARDMYKDKMKLEQWKNVAFEKEILSYFSSNNNTQNIVSIGDADYEFYALINYENYENKHKNLKTVRFISSPTFYSLIDQLNILLKSIENICTQQKHMDLKFESLNTTH